MPCASHLLFDLANGLGIGRIEAIQEDVDLTASSEVDAFKAVM